MQKTIALIAALCALSAAPVTRAAAQSASDAANTSTTISLDGQVVMRIRTGAGGYTAGQRAEAVRSRLTRILSLRRLRPGDVTVTTAGPAQANILVRGRLLLTVDPTLAQANGQSPARLAQAWAASLRRALPEAAAVRGPQYQNGQL